MRQSVAEPYDRGCCATLISDTVLDIVRGAGGGGVAAVAEPLGIGQFICDSVGVEDGTQMTFSVSADSWYGARCYPLASLD